MRVTIVDYGLSNLLSVSRAVQKLGHRPCFARTGAEVREAEVILLPGVGAFSGGMAGLMQRGMLAPLWGCAESGVPILGICLGMQMLFESSHENGIHRGLGLIPGHVEPIPRQQVNGEKLLVPHIGWAAVHPSGGQPEFDGVVGRCTHPDDEFYFVHGYVAKPRHTAHILGECGYGGHKLCAMVGRDNIFGTQFHPEKSGPAGLNLLAGFLQAAASQQKRLA